PAILVMLAMLGAGASARATVAGPPAVASASASASAPRSPSAPSSACSSASFAPAQNYGAGSALRSVAVGDFNGDGKQDLATATNALSGTVSVLLGDGTGSFGAATNFPVGNYPYSVAVGDFNGDGKRDLAVGHESSNFVSILLGD